MRSRLRFQAPASTSRTGPAPFRQGDGCRGWVWYMASNPMRVCAKLLKANESPRGVQVLVDEPACRARPRCRGGAHRQRQNRSRPGRMPGGCCLRGRPIPSSLLCQRRQRPTQCRIASKSASKAFNASNVVLAHGHRAIHAFERMVRRPRRYAPGTEEASARCSTWLRRVASGCFFGQVRRVHCAHQTLLSVLPVRHKFVRDFGMNGNPVLIVDEVHALRLVHAWLIGRGLAASA